MRAKRARYGSAWASSLWYSSPFITWVGCTTTSVQPSASRRSSAWGTLSMWVPSPASLRRIMPLVKARRTARSGKAAASSASMAAMFFSRVSRWLVPKDTARTALSVIVRPSRYSRALLLA